jgi:peroxiredoxin
VSSSTRRDSVTISTSPIQRGRKSIIRRVAVLDPGVLMPPLPLIDEDGRPLPASDGETLYVAFKTTCPTCALTWPFLERVREASEGGMRVIGISQDPAAQTREFQERHGAHIEIGYDPQPWPISERIGLTTVPSFFRVGADGTLEESFEGWDRERVRALARRGAELAGREAVDILRPGEQAPAIKPG